MAHVRRYDCQGATMAEFGIAGDAAPRSGRLLLLVLWRPGSNLEQRLRPIADVVPVLGWEAAASWLERQAFDAVVCELDDVDTLNHTSTGLPPDVVTLCITPEDFGGRVAPPLVSITRGPTLSNDILRVLRGSDAKGRVGANRDASHRRVGAT